jgi:hypothetical protein
MAELNERAREHAEASRRLLGGEGGPRPETESVTYWNPAGEIVYWLYSSNYGGGSGGGSAENLPDVPPNVVQHSESGGQGGVVSTTIDNWTVPPWEGWKAVFIFTIGLRT